MTRRVEQESVTTVREVAVEVRCDLCGVRAYRPRNGEGAEWADTFHDVREVHVSFRTGEAFPESGETKTIRFDICPNCFVERLQAWLVSQGAEPTVVKRSW